MAARVLEVKEPNVYPPDSLGSAFAGNDSRGRVLIALPAIDYSRLGDELLVTVSVEQAVALRKSIEASL